MKYYIIAGEASGDLHGSNLIKSIKEKDVNAEIRCWGGDLMQQAGGDVVKHIKELAFMGFVEVLMNIRTIMKNMKFCKQDILDFKPDALVFIDYPGFNLRIAEFAKKNKIKSIYYISPQIWAWKQSRVHQIKRDIDKMLVILPFEEAFYQKFNYQVHFVGHPLLDAIENYSGTNLDPELLALKDSGKKIVAILPGSRTQEIKTMLPIMLSVRSNFPDYEFVIAGAPSKGMDFYRDFVGEDIKVVLNKTYQLLSISHAALVTSGTATLETALFNVPEVVCYKGSPISYQIAKRLIKVKYISLVNLIMDREVVKELIQNDLNKESISKELKSLLDGQRRNEVLNDYKQLKQNLGGKGASERAANYIKQFLENA